MPGICFRAKRGPIDHHLLDLDDDVSTDSHLYLPSSSLIGTQSNLELCEPPSRRRDALDKPPLRTPTYDRMSTRQTRRQAAKAAEEAPLLDDKHQANVNGNGAVHVAPEASDAAVEENIFLFWPNIVGMRYA